jgi:ATP/maltotriose-dependent transcriptional regulator MalT
MAWKEGVRLGDRGTPGLMKSHMHYRSRELNFRSAFSVGEVGKSQKDAWNKPERVYLDKPRSKNNDQTIGDVVLNTYTTPFDFAITNDFLNSLSEQETNILNDLSAGYTQKEIAQRHHVTPTCLKTLRHGLEAKAVEYLM